MDGATAVAQEWAHTWGGSAADSGSAVAVDPSSGAAYVTGPTSSFGAGNGFSVSRFGGYDNSGFPPHSGDVTIWNDSDETIEREPLL